MPIDPISRLFSASKPGAFVNAMRGRTAGCGPDDLDEQGLARPVRRRAIRFSPRLLPAMGLLVLALSIVALRTG